MTELRSLLARIRRRWLFGVAARATFRVLLGWAALVALATLADRILPASDVATLIRAVVFLLSMMAVAALVVWSSRSRPDDRRVARFVEERCPELDDEIVTAVDLESRRDPSTLAPFIIEHAVARLRALDVRRVVSTRELRGLGVRVTAAAAALTIAAVLAVPFGARVAELARLRYWPSSIVVAVVPGSVRIPEGRPLRITARVQSNAGRAISHVTPELAIVFKGEVRTVPMQRAGDGFEARINAVDRSFAYSVRAGRAVSRTYDVTALLPPRVAGIDLHYDYPPFTRLPPRDEKDGGDIYAPAATRVRLRVRVDRPVASGQLMISESHRAVPLARVNDRLLEATLSLTDDGAYRIVLTDADRLVTEGTEYFIRLVADRPPDVHIMRPSGDQQITPLEEIAIEARADDDFGVDAFDLVYSVAGGVENVVPFTSVTGTPLAKVGTRLVAAEDLHVKPGDVIAYYARARDVPHAKQPTLSRSEIFFLEVKPFNEEYVLAASQAMSAAAGTQIESLIAAQKEIISATWNLERRSAAGRSATDVKSVADAQAELKAKTQGAASVLGPKRGAEPPQDQLERQPSAARGAGDPVSDAVAAMAKALEHLETRKTKEAIPHEMSALNALLRAQADVRRRQVTQQASGSTSFGNGRQGQDLSNLFDRELKRQQRTNYEQRAQVEQQPESQDASSALDRIRELARRQEDLSRRLRDTANLSDEERKRELEKLAREEEELRKQLQEGSKGSSGSAVGSAGSGSKGSQSSGSGEGAERAMEQMQRSMSEMRRNDPSAAAARGEDAAKQLRDLESKMESGAGDARKRALGDLQMESRQLAAEQERVAGEADRAAREAGGSDARRRVADEQERLAQRAEALKDAAKRLENDRGAPAGDRAAAAGVARDLDSQRVGERMRAAAEGLRKGEQSREAAAQARQAADGLEKVARSVAGAGAGGATGETQRLRAQLEEIGAARDRLTRLEQQMREAQREGSRGAAPGRGQRGRDGQSGQQGQSGSRGSGQGGDASRLQQEYARELQRTRDMLGRLERGTPDSGRNMTTPEEHEWSRSAPGMEAWKQDFGAWKTLSEDVTRSLERSEAAVADRLAKSRATDRLRAGGSDRVPDAYRQRVSRYFELLAQKRGSDR